MSDVMNPATPPNSINQIVDFSADACLVLKWCMLNLLDETDHMSSNNMMALDDSGCWRWIISSYENKMLFSRQDDVFQFLLAWGTCA